MFVLSLLFFHNELSIKIPKGTFWGGETKHKNIHFLYLLKFHTQQAHVLSNLFIAHMLSLLSVAVTQTFPS